ncbi:MAG: aminoglycoside phosphotransferase family protein [Patescibacteria group bacterium]
MTDKDFSEILNLWQKDFYVNLDFEIQGSPERSLERYAIEDKQRERFILEKIPPKNLERKQEIADNLKLLVGHGFDFANTYLSGNNGKSLQKYENDFWQLSTYISGEELDRSNYWQEADRGRKLAQSLLELYRVSEKLDLADTTNFSLIEYLEKLVEQIKQNNPKVYFEILPVFEMLQQQLFPAYPQLPKVFCHGDPHPINIIWKNGSVGKMIDWEFSGYKPYLYDIALIIGCVGAEAKDALSAGFLESFRNEIFVSKFIAQEDLVYLDDFILAIRFAWLSEWLRRNDKPMIDFEIFYLKLLTKKR